MRRVWLTAAALAVMTAACAGAETGGPGTADSDQIRIASFDFEESRLVAELYAQVLEGAGFQVARLGAVGPREVVAPALEQGLIDLIPEYVGSAATHFGAASIDAPGLTVALAERGLEVLEPAPAEDVNVFVVTETTAHVEHEGHSTQGRRHDDRFARSDFRHQLVGNRARCAGAGDG